MAKVQTQRGLKNYIQELRNCTTREAEKERVDKEMGKIRKKYTSEKAMSAYDKRKYMWKLLYTRLLGYEVEFGQKQAMDLIAAPTFAEKQVGYVGCSIFLNEKDELLRLVINSVRNDLISRNEAFQCLALDFIANVGGAEFAQLLTSDVMNVLTNGATRPAVRKKAALCLLRLIRKAPPDADIMPAEEWSVRMASLLEDRDPGVLLGLTTLLLGVVSRNYQGYEACVPRLVHILERMKTRDVAQDYTYYGIASPWLQVRALRTLQYFPPPEDPVLLKTLMDTVRRILAGTEANIKNVNKSNAVHAILFEAIALAVGLGDPDLLNTGVGLLVRFLTVREANLRYLALENLGRLAEAPEVAESVGRHQKTVLGCLQDPDNSIRRRALDLVFATCNPSTAPTVVEELLAQLPRADYASREDIVLKAAVLAERFLPSREWYVDSMLKLMEAGGEAATDDIWQSVVQIVAGDQALHGYVASKCCQGLERGANNEVYLRCAAFVIGEYGAQATDKTPMQKFQLLNARFFTSTPETKAMLLSAYGKMRAAYPNDAPLAAAIDDVLSRHNSAPDAELQQRAMEYLALAASPNASSIALQPLPPWEKRSSLLLKRLAEREGEGEDESRELPSWVHADDGQQQNGAPVEKLEVSVPSSDAVEEPTTATSAGNGNTSIDLMDLLDLSEEPVEPSTPAQPDEKEEEPSALAMLAGLGGASAVVASANPFADTPPPALTTSAAGGQMMAIQPIGDVNLWYRKLCLGQSGVFYEDANLQVGMKMDFTGTSGQLGIFLGNKAKEPLQRLVCSVAPSPAFDLQMSSAPHVLEPGKQVQLPLMATCLEPFVNPPVLQLGYKLGTTSGSAQTTLELPLVVTKFCQPVDVPNQVFITRWNQVVGAPFKLQERFAKPAAATHASVAALLTTLHFKVLQGVDADESDTISAACIFHCSAGAGQSSRQIPCMIKVQGVAASKEQGIMSVTVATADAMMTDALKIQLVAHIQDMH